MTVVSRLRAAFGVQVAILAILLVYHVRTIQNGVAAAHALAEISTRIRTTSTLQRTRLADLEENAAKFAVTLDAGYLSKYRDTYQEYDAELGRLRQLNLDPSERQALAILAAEWQTFAPTPFRLARFMSSANGGTVLGQDSLATLQQQLELLQLQTQRLGEASQEAMSAQIARSETAARAAEQLAWIGAGLALLLSIVISAVLARSIDRPLQRLADGTREVAEGRFDYRLDDLAGGRLGGGRDEFAAVARAFNTMTARLAELDQMKRDFVSNVSHDLKTPLSSMQETIGIVLDEVPGPLLPKQRELLELTQESAERLRAMLTKLLDLSRLESGITTAPEPRPIDLDLVIQSSVRHADAARSERELRIGVQRVDGPAVSLRGDPDRIQQVVDNLLENAVKFSPVGATVQVTLRNVAARPAGVPVARWSAVAKLARPPRAAWITVADSGPGVPDAEKERVFERFYQTTAGRAVRGRGVGLGLTICREIVTGHGGAMWISDNPAGSGSVFNVLLPGVAGPGTPRGESQTHSGAAVGETVHS